MGLPPSSENLKASRASTESFQHRRVYQIETETEPMVEVQYLELEPIVSNATSDRVSHKEDGSAALLSDKDDNEVIAEVKDLGEMNDLDEVNELMDEHIQRGDWSRGQGHEYSASAGQEVITF